jgi:hypothetical protein
MRVNNVIIFGCSLPLTVAGVNHVATLQVQVCTVLVCDKHLLLNCTALHSLEDAIKLHSLEDAIKLHDRLHDARP